MKKERNALIIELNDFLIDIISTYLSGDFNCLTAHTKEEAEALMDRRIDVAVLSTNIPGDAAMELLSELKSKGTGVVVLNSELFSEQRIALLKMGADDVMTKPFHPEELRLRVQRLVR